MKICTETEKKPLELIAGNLYQHDGGAIYIGVVGSQLIHLKSGRTWAYDKGFDGDDDQFADVTDQYCLKKIS